MQHETDGRRRRSAASRKRIVDAMIAMIREGNIDPSAEAVADRAGLGRRTVFRLFTDKESIYRQIHVTIRDRALAYFDIPIVGDTPSARLLSLVDRRCRFFEDILPLATASAAHRHTSPVLQRDHAAVAAELRGIMEAFLDPAIRADLPRLEALDLVMSIEAWRRLRHQQGLDPAAATEVMRRAVQALLSAPAAPAR